MKSVQSQLRGKRIKLVRLNPFADGAGEKAYDPEIIFTDGSVLRFGVQETEVGKYGVRFYYPGCTMAETKKRIRAIKKAWVEAGGKPISDE